MRPMHVEMLDDALVQVYRAWSPARRLQAGANQTRFVRRMLGTQLASLHPAWDRREVDEEVARRFSGNAV